MVTSVTKVARPRAAPPAAPLQERELVALWLLGRVPDGLLPWPLLRAGRAGRGPGPDVREAAFRGPHGVVLCGDVEVHLAAGDFVHHGHLGDPAYAGVALHLVWTDDRPLRGGPQPLPGGGDAPTVEVGPALGRDPDRLRRLLRRGPRGVEPCATAARTRGVAATSEIVRAEGRRRLAERAWRAAELAAEHGWDGAWSELLDGALRGSAGRRRETAEERAALAARLSAALFLPARGDTPPLPPRGNTPPLPPRGNTPPLPLRGDTPRGPDVLRVLRTHAVDGGARPRVLIAAFHVEGAVGPGRAAEVGWNGRAATPRGRCRRLRRRPARARHGGSRGTLACAAPVRPHARPRGSARPAAARRRRAARAGPPPLAGPLVRTRRLRGVSTLFAGVTSACRRCGDRDHATSAGSLRARLWQRAATPCFRAGSALSTRRSRFCGSAPLESVARGHGPGRSRTCGEAREPGGIMEPGGRAQRSSAAGAVESAREWMVSGGARGLQNRCGAALQSRVGSTPTHSRHRRSPG